jgi:ATP-dependent helicase/DNAse subunit B
MGDFLKCPRLYYLHNMYKNPKTNAKISLVSPYMSLGVAVHEVLEGLGKYKAEERLKRDLMKDYELAWEKVSGKRGGFVTPEQESEFKERGKKMLENVIKNPRMLGNKVVKLPKEKMNPNFLIDTENNIILNGLVDWIEYIEESDSLHLVDFKTGKNEEVEGSLQLPIYLLLCNALQKRKVSKASYWYLETDKIVEKELPDAEQAKEDVLEIARKVKKFREGTDRTCIKGEHGCMYCEPYERIVNGQAEFVGIGNFNQELYLI